MRALSLSQPWASLVVGFAGRPGPKAIENRPATASLMAQARALLRSGDTFALHAAKSYDSGTAAEIGRQEFGLPHRRELPSGVVIGTARVVEVGALDWFRAMKRLPADQERWAFGPFCILLADRRLLARPIPCRGMLGFWHLPAEVETDVLAQMGGGR